MADARERERFLLSFSDRVNAVLSDLAPAKLSAHSATMELTAVVTCDATSTPRERAFSVMKPYRRFMAKVAAAGDDAWDERLLTQVTQTAVDEVTAWVRLCVYQVARVFVPMRQHAHLVLGAKSLRAQRPGDRRVNKLVVLPDDPVVACPQQLLVTLCDRLVVEKKCYLNFYMTPHLTVLGVTLDEAAALGRRNNLAVLRSFDRLFVLMTDTPYYVFRASDALQESKLVSAVLLTPELFAEELAAEVEGDLVAVVAMPSVLCLCGAKNPFAVCHAAEFALRTHEQDQSLGVDYLVLTALRYVRDERRWIPYVDESTNAEWAVPLERQALAALAERLQPLYADSGLAVRTRSDVMASIFVGDTVASCGVCGETGYLGEKQSGGSEASVGCQRRLSRCAGCKAQVYCSRACQRRDWPTHKVQCKK